VTFWTPLLVASGYLVVNKCVVSLSSAIAVSVVSIILAVIFSKWRLFIQKMNCLDRQKAIFWKNLYLKACGVEPPSKYIENLYPSSALQGRSILGIHEGVDWKKESPWDYPSVWAHLTITWLLVIGFLFLVWVQACSSVVANGTSLCPKYLGAARKEFVVDSVTVDTIKLVAETIMAAVGALIGSTGIFGAVAAFIKWRKDRKYEKWVDEKLIELFRLTKKNPTQVRLDVVEDDYKLACRAVRDGYAQWAGYDPPGLKIPGGR